MSNPTFVRERSPVADAGFLQNWDSSVRKNFSDFELNITGLKQGIDQLYRNPLTRFRDPVQFGHRYNEVRSLQLRQQVGQIHRNDVSELNSVLGSARYSISLSRGQLVANDNITKVALLGSLGIFGLSVVKRFNLLWAVGSFAPFVTASLYSRARQPEQLLQNCYSYLIEKRQATAQLYSHQSSFDSQDFAKSSEFAQLRSQMKQSGKTIYEIENELIAKIDKN